MFVSESSENKHGPYNRHSYPGPCTGKRMSALRPSTSHLASCKQLTASKYFQYMEYSCFPHRRSLNDSSQNTPSGCFASVNGFCFSCGLAPCPHLFLAHLNHQDQDPSERFRSRRNEHTSQVSDVPQVTHHAVPIKQAPPKLVINTSTLHHNRVSAKPGDHDGSKPLRDTKHSISDSTYHSTEPPLSASIFAPVTPLPASTHDAPKLIHLLCKAHLATRHSPQAPLISPARLTPGHLALIHASILSPATRPASTPPLCSWTPSDLGRAILDTLCQPLLVPPTDMMDPLAPVQNSLAGLVATAHDVSGVYPVEWLARTKRWLEAEAWTGKEHVWDEVVRWMVGLVPVGQRTISQVAEEMIAAQDDRGMGGQVKVPRRLIEVMGGRGRAADVGLRLDASPLHVIVAANTVARVLASHLFPTTKTKKTNTLLVAAPTVLLSNLVSSCPWKLLLQHVRETARQADRRNVWAMDLWVSQLVQPAVADSPGGVSVIALSALVDKVWLPLIHGLAVAQRLASDPGLSSATKPEKMYKIKQQARYMPAVMAMLMCRMWVSARLSVSTGTEATQVVAAYLILLSVQAQVSPSVFGTEHVPSDDPKVVVDPIALRSASKKLTKSLHLMMRQVGFAACPYPTAHLVDELAVVVDAVGRVQLDDDLQEDGQWRAARARRRASQAVHKAAATHVSESVNANDEDEWVDVCPARILLEHVIAAELLSISST
ncbi:hypothetical protein BCR44DRAFT_95805 [Catenaria anguillulae PL171]|uniref:Uncharacterized protein n=1 Tax=Catenaria anguillulae PL171 TaxID=765915 RepID=A0A1Y2HGP0_9FUNG|nr:hypothetical protein BCR44DRAFT_95805 [Catenaria anguillulae PL171]